MRLMGTFGSFTTARLGIYAAQQGLNTTGHNITNINTVGYTRQHLDQVALRTGAPDRFGSQFSAIPGNGVLLTGISQIRDPFLDIRFRDEQASVGQSDAKLSGLEDLSRVLDEIRRADGSGVLEKQFNDMLTQIRGLSTRVGQDDFDTLVRSSASNLVSLLNSYSERLDTVYNNQVEGFNQDVDRVNEILKSIADINDAIMKSDIHGDPGLELRDQRNLYIDELSQYMKINVRYEKISIGLGEEAEKLVIFLGGNDNGDPEKSRSILVDDRYCTQLSITQVYDITKSPPDWIQKVDKDNKPVFDKNGDPVMVINPENPGTMIDNDHFLLTLSALKDSRGRVHETFNKDVDLGDNDLYGSLQGTREILTEAGEFTDLSVLEGKIIPDFSVLGRPDLKVPPLDLNAGTKRGIPYYRQAIDALAVQFANVLNNANTGYMYNSDGVYVNGLGEPLAQFNGVQLGKDTVLTDDMRAYLDDMIDDPTLDAEKKPVKLGGPLFSISSDSNVTDGITAANISISRAWDTGDVRIVNSFQMGNSGGWSADNLARPNNTDPANIDHIIVEFTGKHNYYSRDVNADAYDKDVSYFNGSFQEMLTSINVTLATDVKATTSKLNNYVTAATELNTSRDNVMGVDLNDETVNLMQYQKSYSAACRLMTTIDEALERLINNTGVVGR